MEGQMTKLAADALTASMLAGLEDPAEKQEIVQRAETYIKRKLREEGFARKIMVPRNVTASELQRDTSSDSLYAVRDLEPDSAALELNFRSQPTGRYIRSKRYMIPFVKISTDDYSKTEAELMAYQMPLPEIVQENSLKDIEEAEDSKFLSLVESALAAGTKVDVGGDAELTRANLVKLLKLIDGNRLQATTMLMSASTVDEVLSFDSTDLGDDLMGKVTVDGYSYNKLLGRKLVVSIKSTDASGLTHFLPEKTVYAFTDQRYLGHFLILSVVKLFLDKYADTVTWRAWEHVGMNIGNVKSVARLRYGTTASSDIKFGDSV